MKVPLPANSSRSPYCWKESETSRYMGNPRMAASTSRLGASRAYGARGRQRLALAPGRRGAGGPVGGGGGGGAAGTTMVSSRRPARLPLPPARPGQLPELSVSVIWVLACLVASATGAGSVKIGTSMSGRMLAASTLPPVGGGG